MQLDFLFQPIARLRPPANAIRIGSREVPIHFIRNRRARRYILRVRPDGSIRATVPRVGSQREAHAFAERSIDWIARQLQRHQEQPPPPRAWQSGTEILFRGEKVVLTVDGNHVRFADQAVYVPNAAFVRRSVERHLRGLAASELPLRTQALAAAQNLIVKRVTVRDQRSRWGSCSRRSTISLNWRLIQTPEFVRDYIILHELMHLREMNHSKRFWALVAQACPAYKEAEAWLKKHRDLLR